MCLCIHLYLSLASNESFIVHLPGTQLNCVLSYLGNNIKFKDVFNCAEVTGK